MNRKEKLHEDFWKVVLWAEKRGIDVIIDNEYEDAYWSDVKQITVSSKNRIENRLYSLLHECGHALVRTNKSNFARQYPAHAEVNYDKRVTNSRKYKVSVLEEEVEAWKRGLRLANRLGIEIDEDKYNKLKTKCLMSYINWACD